MDMQNVSNLQIPEGAVRTIHDKNNRLIWGAVGYDTKYAGDTYQQTYSGKNLFSSVIEVGGINASGQLTNFTTRARSRTKIAVQPNTGYTLSMVPKDSSKTINMTVQGWKSDGTFISQITGSQWVTVPVTFTTPANCTQITISGRYSDDTSFGTLGSETDAFQNIQLETGSQPTSYEPYTGGIPAPNPDYPQAVQVVAGEQTVAIGDGDTSQSYPLSLTGKNLFDVSTFVMGGMNNGQLTVMNYRITNITNPLEVKPNTEYTISIQLGGDIQGFRIGIHELDENKAFLADSGWQQLVPNPYTFTTRADAKYIGIVCSCSVTSTTVTTGSTESHYGATTPTQWLRGCKVSVNESGTDIELCKIGDYQDYIYKSGDDWYAHKAIGKISSYNGETITTDYISTTGSLTNGATVYYCLATSTDTKITDATLLGQLDAVHEWLTRYGYTSTVTGNLPIIIDRTNL